jgi:putative two-component system response regulator
MADILLIGQDRQAVSGVRDLLRGDGHHVTRHVSNDDWLQAERDTAPELVVATAESAPEMLAAEPRPLRGFPAPLLFVRQDSTFSRDLSSENRLVDQITSPFMREELLARVDALVRVRRVIRHGAVPDPLSTTNTETDGSPGAHNRRGDFLGRVASFLGASLPKSEKPLAPYLEVAARVAEWADRRDAFQPGHAERVASFCGMMSDGLDLDEEETGALLRAAMLHDIGKVALPVEMLHQREPLQESQKRLIRTHPRRGAALLRALDKDDRVARTVLFHHECPNGSGYYGKAEEGIPRTARILAVAEVYDAMTASLHGGTMSRGEALNALRDRRGETVDAECVDALVDTFKPRKKVIPLDSTRF